MEPTNPLNDQLTDFDKPPIYSRNAVRGFAIFFSAIFGGVLLMQNLNSIGNPGKGRIAFGISVAITICEIAIGMLIGKATSSMGIILSILGATVLSEYVYRKYIPNEADYSKKPIWKPLIVGLIIFIPIVVFLVYADLHGANQ